MGPSKELECGVFFLQMWWKYQNCGSRAWIKRGLLPFDCIGHMPMESVPGSVQRGEISLPLCLCLYASWTWRRQKSTAQGFAHFLLGLSPGASGLHPSCQRWSNLVPRIGRHWCPCLSSSFLSFQPPKQSPTYLWLWIFKEGLEDEGTFISTAIPGTRSHFLGKEI